MNLLKKSPRASLWRNAAAVVTVLLFALQGLTPQTAAASAPAPAPVDGEYAPKFGAHAAGSSGFRADNPVHGWNIAYGADGATQLTQIADTGDWQWSLALTGYGYGDLVDLSAPRAVQGERVAGHVHLG